MEGAKTLTHLLFPVLIGLIIGGAVSGNTTLLVWAIILLVADIIVGIALQNAIENAGSRVWNALSPEQKREVALSVIERIKRNIEAENMSLCEKMDCMIENLRQTGRKAVTSIATEPAGRLLVEACAAMPHAPMAYTFVKIHSIYTERLGGNSAIVYAFRFNPSSVCENACIYLVRTKQEKIRLFAVETDFGTLALCEYCDGSHLNYGAVEKSEVNKRIGAILEEDEDHQAASTFR